MTPAELAAIRERANNATPGPWEASEAVDETEFGSYVAYGVAPIAPLEWYSDSDAAHTALDVMDKADAEFIAHARTDIPALLDHVETLATQVAAVRELHREGRNSCCAGGTICDHCEMRWPCPTIQALDGD